MAKDAPPPNDRTRIPAFAEHDSRHGRSITANVTPEHYELVSRTAREHGVSVASYARTAVLQAAQADTGEPVDLAVYADVRDLAGRYRMSVAELQRVALAEYMRRHSPPAQSDGIPDEGRRTRKKTSHSSGEYESARSLPVAAKVASSAPPPRRRR